MIIVTSVHQAFGLGGASENHAHMCITNAEDSLS